jgi:hypothetical protein
MKSLYFFIAIHNWKFLFFLCPALCAINISAQVHIGSDTPPDPSAMLEISATDKGILLPSVALAAVNDSSVIVNNTTVDGLLVFNTTENASLNLYKGVYAWNSVKHLWENIVSDQSFIGALISHYATEETYFVSNIQTAKGNASNAQQIGSGQTAKLTFESGISINKENCFDVSNNKFVVPKNGYYKIVCGAEIYFHYTNKKISDKVGLHLQLIDPSDPKAAETVSAESTRGYDLNDNKLYVPLTPSIVYNSYLKKGVEITVSAIVDSNTSLGWVNRKYLYVNTF